VERPSSPTPRNGPLLALSDEHGQHARLSDAVAARLGELVQLDAGDLTSRLEEGSTGRAWRLEVRGVPVNRP
jgi:hypothetical protein